MMGTLVHVLGRLLLNVLLMLWRVMLHLMLRRLLHRVLLLLTSTLRVGSNWLRRPLRWERLMLLLLGWISLIWLVCLLLLLVTCRGRRGRREMTPGVVGGVARMMVGQVVTCPSPSRVTLTVTEGVDGAVAGVN